MDEVALEALYNAAEAIRLMAGSGISEVSVDSDNNSGELFFTVVASGREYKMSLEEVDPE